MDVLEEEDERLHLGDALHHLARGPGDLLRAALAFERLHQPGGEPEDVGDRLLGAALAELLERLLERVVVRDAGRRLHHLAERPVGDALAVRKRATDQDARALDAVEELTCETALPDAGLAVDREEVRTAVAKAAVEGVLEELELGVATDERSARPDRTRRAVEHVDDAPGSKRAVDALQLERACVLDDEAARGETVCGRADEDLARPRRLLEPRGEVHGLARRERRLGVVDDDLARLDADARLELELVDGLAHRERGARRPLRVVLVRLRNAERGHHGVAGELLDDAAVLHDARRRPSRRTR